MSVNSFHGNILNNDHVSEKTMPMIYNTEGRGGGRRNQGPAEGDCPRQYKRAEAEGAAEGRSRGGEGGEGAEGKIKEPLTEVREQY